MDYTAIRSWRFDDIEQETAPRDTMLYALGIGVGHDPLDAEQLRFVTETALRAVPTMACTLASPGFWLSDPRTGVNAVRAVHGEQDLRILSPLPVSGRITGHNEVTGISDKGAGRGALLRVSRSLNDGRTPLAELHQTLFLRDEGGFSADHPERSEPLETLPSIACDLTPELEIALPTIPQAALLYRLSGDYAPLHSDPVIAAAAGFPRPILHGLCSFGMAGHAALQLLCGYDPARLKRLAARFSAPAYPGETLSFAFYRDSATQFRFRASVAERNVVVLDNGIVELSAEASQ